MGQLCTSGHPSTSILSFPITELGREPTNNGSNIEASESFQDSGLMRSTSQQTMPFHMTQDFPSLILQESQACDIAHAPMSPTIAKRLESLHPTEVYLLWVILYSYYHLCF